MSILVTRAAIGENSPNMYNFSNTNWNLFMYTLQQRAMLSNYASQCYYTYGFNGWKSSEPCFKAICWM